MTMRIQVAGMDPDDVYERLARFEEYADHTGTVREVVVTEESVAGFRSKWEVNFRDGILRWEEHDRFFPRDRRIEFQASGGDLDMFVGSWAVEEAPEGSVVAFQADFDLGLSTLNEMVEPIAEEALRETIDSIVEGLTDGLSEVVEGAAATAPS